MAEMPGLSSVSSEIRDRLRLRRVVRPDGDGRFRLQTDGRSLADLLGLFDEKTIADLPIETLVIDKTLNARTLPGLLASPHLRRIRRLRLIDLKLGDGTFEQLLAAPGLAALIELRLYSTEVGQSGLAAIAKLGLRLEQLDVSGAAVDERDLQSLVRSEALSSLRHFGVSRPLGSDSLQAIIQAPSLARLRSLSLRGCKLSTSDMALFTNASATALEDIVLSSNPFAGSALRQLAGAPFAATLTRLELQSTAVDDAALAHLAKAPISLQSLSLSHSRVRGSGFPALLENPSMWELETLTLAGQLTGGEDGDRVAAAIAPLTRLRSLSLPSMSLTDAGARAIAQHAAGTLTSLNVRCNRLTSAGAAALAAGRYLGSLETLELEAYPTYPKIEAAGAVALGRAPFAQLRRLNLRKQNIGGEGARALAALPALREVELWDCEVDDAALEALSRAAFASQLELLDISFNPATALEPIGRFRRLCSLSLSDTQASDAVVAEMIANVPESLEQVALDYAANLGPSTLAALVAKAGQLVDVSASFKADDGAKKTLRAALTLPKRKPKRK